MEFMVYIEHMCAPRDHAIKECWILERPNQKQIGIFWICHSPKLDGSSVNHLSGVPWNAIRLPGPLQFPGWLPIAGCSRV
jgi:hypothetical protein